MNGKWMAVAGLGFLASQVGAQEAASFKTEQDMVSYGIGIYMAKSFQRNDIDLDRQLLIKGLQDGLAGKSLVPEPQLRGLMRSYEGELRRKAAVRHRLAATENEKKGASFLEQNKARDGVVTLASGVEYKVLKAGEGRRPTADDAVECLYRGTKVDGTEFDATEPGKPATLKVGDLIPGWKEALQLMPAGSRWQVVVPPHMAYGMRGVGGDIGPNETLIYDVELVAVK